MAIISTTAAAAVRTFISQSFANISLMQLQLAHGILEISERANSLRTSYNFITLNKGIVQKFVIVLKELHIGIYIHKCAIIIAHLRKFKVFV